MTDKGNKNIKDINPAEDESSLRMIENAKRAFFEHRLKNPSMVGTVNMSRMIKDWDEITRAMKKNLAYPLKYQRIYPYLCDDIRDLPIEEFAKNPYIDLPCGILLNVILFKDSMEEGIEDMKEQIKASRETEKPQIVYIDDLIDELGFSEKFSELLKYQFRFAFNKEKESHPYLRKTDVVFEKDSDFILMKIKDKTISRASLVLDTDDDIFVI